MKAAAQLDRETHGSRIWWMPAAAAATLIAIFMIPAAILLGMRLEPTADIVRANDELVFHYPVIETFSEQLPSPDVSDYLAAMTPGYHLVIAAVHRWITQDLLVLRAVGSLFSIALVGMLGWLMGRSAMRTGLAMPEVVVLALPLLASLYVFPCAIWLVPDNAGWACVLLMLGAVLTRPPTLRWIWIGAIALVLVVLFRQINLWTAGLMWLAAWLGPPDRAGTQPSTALEGGVLPSDIDPIKRKLTRVALAIAVTIPAALVLAWFAGQWGGKLVPPAFQPGATRVQAATQYAQQFNPAALGLVAFVFGVASAFFAGYIIPRWRQSLIPMRQRLILLAICAAAGAIVGILPISEPTLGTGSMERASGYWNVLARLPIVADRSPAFALGAIAGGLAAGAWLAILPPRQRWILMGAVAGIAIACSSTPITWQRYNEPLVLMVLPLCVAMSARARPEPGIWGLLTRFAWLGPLAFAIIQLIILTLRMS